MATFQFYFSDLALPRGSLQFVIVVFPDHTPLLFFSANDFEMNFAEIFAIYLTKFKWCIGRVFYHHKIFGFKNAKNHTLI